MLNRLYKILSRTVFVFVLTSGTALAQQPRYLPADIPLDVDEIYLEIQSAVEYSDITKNIISELIRNHYEEINLNDEFSSKMLDSYIKNLDGSRIYFTSEDIAEFEQYRDILDDMLLDGDLSAGYLIYNRYQKRLLERMVYSVVRVEEDRTDFDFSLDEFIIVDREEVPWSVSHAELEDLWRKRVKSSVLSLKLTDKEIPEVRELLSKRFRSQLSQILKTNGMDVYQRYINTMTMTFDPHTQYYPPRAAENFNMSMRLSLEGIGAVLTTEDEYTKVVSIVSGGPADIAGELQPSDRITGVAQAEGEFVDVIGWRVDDVVQLIRGAKGSIVRLNVIPNAAEDDLKTTIIKITRDTVKLEEQSAKKEIIEIDFEGGTYKIGVIELPTFYIDFEAQRNRDSNYRSSTRDVKNLLEELKAEDVDGVVMDLRRNGGGALNEANSLVGLFIRRGPTVQVRDADGNNRVQGDPNPEIIYEGPLGVLVNRLSASASEIFAGAIQDYQRGVVLGSQTFGKGTVQELVLLNEGQLKITRAKFYRISGESTQHKGVTPDIVFPDIYDASDEIGESTLIGALPWDTIDANYYRPYADLKLIIPALISRHEARLENDPDFNFIRAQIQHAIENRERNELTLNEEKLLSQREENDAWRLEVENIRRVAKGREPLSDLNALDAEDEEESEETSVSKNLDEPVSFPVIDLDDGQAEPAVVVEEDADPYLIESGRILLDLIQLQSAGTVAVVIQ